MPTALITERNARTISVGVDDKGITHVQATRTFDVSGVDSAADALAALNNAGIVYYAEHPQDPRAVVSDIAQADNVPAAMYTYTVTYDSSNSTSASLLEPPTIRYDPYVYTEMTDRDANGVPYTNTAGFPFEGGFEQEKEGVVITIARWEQTYSIQKHFQYAGFTNEGTFSLPGGTLSDGQAKCTGIFQGEKSTISTVVRVEYKFDCRADGWKKNVIDQGPLGWGAVPNDDDDDRLVGEFVAGPDSSPVGSVRLDGNGFPMNSDFQVSSPYVVGMNPIQPYELPPSADLVNDDLSTDDITVLSFAKNKSKSFSGLNI